MFVHRVRPRSFQCLMKCLDTGAEFVFDGSYNGACIAQAVAESLVQLLASLPEPVVPIALHSECARASSRDEAFEVSASHRTVFEALP